MTSFMISLPHTTLLQLCAYHVANAEKFYELTLSLMRLLILLSMFLFVLG